MINYVFGFVSLLTNGHYLSPLVLFEVKGFHHNLVLPTDTATGKITGTRLYSTILVIKEFDCSSPYLYKAVATGQNLSAAEIK